MIIGYTVAEALDVPSIFTERKEGAMTLRRGFRIGEGERGGDRRRRVTTGKSTRETAAVVEALGGRVAGFASILNRSGKANPFDAPYESLLSLDLETYDESSCPLVREWRPDRFAGIAVLEMSIVELIAVRGNEAELRVDGRTHFVPFVVNGSEVNFALDGEIWVVEVPGKGSRGARQASRSLHERADAGRGVENPRRRR